MISVVSTLTPGQEPPLAAHLATPRALYTHHGIYVGQGRVIHYAGFAYGLWRGPVENVTLDRFARGHGVRVLADHPRFDAPVVLQRASSRLGEQRYRFWTNNCEHFCAWVLRDETVSTQVERFVSLPKRAWRALTVLVSRSDSLVRPRS